MNKLKWACTDSNANVFDPSKHKRLYPGDEGYVDPSKIFIAVDRLMTQRYFKRCSFFCIQCLFKLNDPLAFIAG